MTFWPGFIVGLCVGLCLGVLITAMLKCGAWADQAKLQGRGMP